MEDCSLSTRKQSRQKYDVVVAYTPSADTCLQLCKGFFFSFYTNFILPLT